MKITQTLYVHKTHHWRSWLRKNHKTTKEIWLIYFKKDSGKPRIAYNDAVDEALCFGWIDSTVKAIDQHRYCQRFSPRRKGSICSEMNKHRAIRMIKEKRMTPAGLAALEGALGKGSKLHQGKIKHTESLKVPYYLEAALKKGKAWENFKKFPLPYKRIRVGWITATRKPDVRKTRMDYFVKMTAQNKRFGMIHG
ncbi:MAG TPA: YdeI/OmpD-associated family protein [bacterium]|nr:YdeI/OmpD-associated family protein [bacterium]